MKRTLIAILTSLPLIAQAAGVNLSFYSIKLPELLKVVYSDVIKKSLVLDSSVVKSEAVITIELNNVKPEEIRSRMHDLVKLHGFHILDRAGVELIGQLTPLHDPVEVETVAIYRPRYRSASYIRDTLRPIIPSPVDVSSPPERVLSVPRTGSDIPVREEKKDEPAPVEQVEAKAEVVIYRGTVQHRAMLASLIEQIDTKPDEIIIKAAIYEVTVDDEDKSALSLALDVLGGKFGLTLGSVTPGNFSSVFKNRSLQVVFDALQKDRRFKVLSSPTLRVQSGNKARLMVGSETPTFGQVSIDRSGNSQQSIVYRPSGVILDLTPQMRDDQTELDIHQQISQFVPTSTGVNSSPTLLKRELSTRVGIQSSDVLILGGLDESRETKESSGLSFLPDFLAAKSAKREKTEILMILQAVKI